MAHTATDPDVATALYDHEATRLREAETCLDRVAGRLTAARAMLNAARDMVAGLELDVARAEFDVEAARRRLARLESQAVAA